MSYLLSTSRRPSKVEIGLASEKRGKSVLVGYGLVSLVVLGIGFRVALVALAGNAMRAPWSGGGDTHAYVLLAQNLTTGKGYTYAGQPSAYRPPAYSMLLAGSMKVSKEHAFAVMRWLQFLAGLLVAYLCAAMAERAFGPTARNSALLMALFSPTLVFTTGEILPEAIATFLSALFLYLLVQYVESPRLNLVVGMSITVGLAILVRSNMAILGLVVLSVILFWKTSLPRWRSAAVAVILPVIVISPWLIRNRIVFHGAALLTTQDGSAAIAGVLTPQGRALPGDAEELKSALGWEPPIELETNAPSRNKLASEPVLDHQCWQAAFRVWRQAGWILIPLIGKKLSYFWLSVDQLAWTGSFPLMQRAARAGGVLAYWGILALAISGGFSLRARKLDLARICLVYGAVVTVAHLPFVMNTRYRIPFMDPMLVVLSGGAVATWLARRLEIGTARPNEPDL